MAAVITMPLMTLGLALVMLVMIVMLMMLVMITMTLVHRCVLRHGVMLMPLVLRRCRHHSGQHKQCQQQLRHLFC